MVDVATEKKSIAWGRMLSEHRSPQAIAAGASFGIALGVMPKDSLLALLILLAMAILPIHQFLACVIAISTTLLSSWTNLLVAPIGERFLQMPGVGACISQLYHIPLLPWFRIENSLVAGAMVFGFLAWLPSYLFAKWFAIQAAQYQLQFELVEIAATRVRRQRPSPLPQLAFSTKQSDFPIEAEVDLIELDPKGQTPFRMPAETQQLEELQVELEAIEELIAETIPEQAVPKTVSQISNSPTLLEIEQELRETVIEVVRFKRPNQNEERVEITDCTIHSPHRDEHTMHLPSTISQPTPSASEAVLIGSASTAPVSIGNAKTPSGLNTTQHFAHPGGKEESLRHILKYVHGMRDGRKEPEKSV